MLIFHWERGILSGGIRSIATALYDLALEHGVEFEFNQNIETIRIENNKATEVISSKNKFSTDIVIANADYEHVDRVMLEKNTATIQKIIGKKEQFHPAHSYFILVLINKLISRIIVFSSIRVSRSTLRIYTMILVGRALHCFILLAHQSQTLT